MRVPIYAQDLLPNAAFKKLAKSLKNRWPDQSSIQQTLANEILSKGLGYLDYYELRSSSLNCTPETPTPSESDARDGIVAALASALQSANENSVTLSGLEAFVETLPLTALTTFKMPASSATSSLITKPLTLDPTSGQVCPVNLTCPAKTTPMYTAPMIRMEIPTPFRRPENSISQKEIKALRQVVKRKSSLRDQSIFFLLESGLRANDILSSQIPHVRNFEPSSYQFKILNSKGRPVLTRADAIGKYIDSAALAPEDYLFPSKKDPATPMSAHELLQIFRSWEKDAQLAPPQRSPRSLRNAAILKSVIKGSALSSNEQIATRMGHRSQYTTEHYTVLSDTDPASARSEKTQKK